MHQLVLLMLLVLSNRLLLSTSMSEEQACVVAQNILNSLGSSPPAPASPPPAYAPAPAHCGTANLANTDPLPPEVLAALVSQLRSGSRSLLVIDALSTEVPVTANTAYAALAESMSDTRELSHRDLEDIVVNLRKQSENDDQGFVDEHIASISDESDYESDETDQVLGVNEHIEPMANPYWRGSYEYSGSCDDEYSGWLSAMAGIVSAVGETELPSSALPNVSALRACSSDVRNIQIYAHRTPPVHRTQWLVAFPLPAWQQSLVCSAFASGLCPGSNG